MTAVEAVEKASALHQQLFSRSISSMTTAAAVCSAVYYREESEIAREAGQMFLRAVQGSGVGTLRRRTK